MEDTYLLEVNHPAFRSQLERLYNAGYLPLGLLGFRMKGAEGLLTRRALFPWLDGEWSETFDKICREFTAEMREYVGDVSPP